MTLSRSSASPAYSRSSPPAGAVHEPVFVIAFALLAPARAQEAAPYTIDSEFDVARFSLAASTPLASPAGHATTTQAWARDLGVTYTPTIVFFDRSGMEVFRIDAYLRPFHLAAPFDYVAGDGYRSEPSFQRYLQARAERVRARGETVDLWC